MVSSKLAIITALALVPLAFINESDGVSYYPSGLHADSAEVTPLASQKVNLSVYYASLCQPCATFIVKNLEGIFNNDLINIINLQLVPWANAYVNETNHSIICQNGPEECELNSLEACALNVWNDVNIHYGLINCFEYMAIDGRHKNWEDCFSQLGLPNEPILNCYNTGNGTEEYENFTRYVCEAYRGTPVPAACNLH
ncbi:Gamma-interferon-inducible lysosomal thiol reductase, partial [Mucuna pruriens]